MRPELKRQLKYIAIAGPPLLAFIVWWSIYAYNDCLMVGHSKLYCIMRIGR